MTGIRSELLIPPYGGTLVDLRAPEDALPELKARASTLPSIQLSDRAVCDLELLAVGAFSPLDRFVGREDYDRILDELRLASGALFPIPVTLPVEPGPAVALDREVALRDRKNNLLATLVIEEVYPWDREAFARAALGTTDARHPLVSESGHWGPVNLSGRLTVLRLPPHHDFQGLRLTPAEVRERLAGFGRSEVVAFQTRNPLHRVHEELTKRAIGRLDGVLLLHPSVGMTKPGDVDHYTRVRTYQSLARHHYEPDRILLSLLPLAMRMAGPREALWHALIRRNYGASHFIVGRDHAGPGNDSTGKPFYGPYDAQQLVERHAEELEVGVIPFHELTYLPDEDRYEETSKVAPGVRTATISGTQVRDDYLNAGRELPGWFTRPEVARILGEAYPPRVQQG
ncbi:MAG TPA: sulfate adenylyltransferase, partial [Gemmatimonadales bacterium]|nr:sulfate adenylyltransferase [Gemmatimonadales bacterium]